MFKPCHWKCIKGWKLGENRGEGVDGFWTVTNSILLFGFQTTVQSIYVSRWNWLRIATVREWTDRQTKQTRVILWSVPCYAIAMEQTAITQFRSCFFRLLLFLVLLFPVSHSQSTHGENQRPRAEHTLVVQETGRLFRNLVERNC